MSESFKDQIAAGYSFKGDSITIGSALFNGEPIEKLLVKLPLKTMNRHGLIAGATGTGKTKTLQVLAEQLSAKGVPSLLMDLKGDISGLAAEGMINEIIAARCKSIGETFVPLASPVEFLTLSKENGVRLRATVSEFGPILLSKILGLNDTQSSVISLIFKYADDNKMPLIDLKDLTRLLQYSVNEGRKDIEKEYGLVSSATVNTILRNVIELEQQGAEQFFGEPSFEVSDLLACDKNGKGIISIIRLNDIQDKPGMFSTFMLCMLAEIYSTLPEAGDLDKPKLCVFIDEAHLVFKNASNELIDQLESIIKLIRSKGVGIYFITQNPTDVPEDVLSQLGLKIQHALRAFTAKDRKQIEKTAENFPESEFYKVATQLTSMGIGEALITSLNEKGIPTPLVVTMIRPPQSRMDILSQDEISNIVKESILYKKYIEDIDRESAYELLKKRIEQAQSAERQQELQEEHRRVSETSTRNTGRPQKTTLEQVTSNTMVRQMGRVVVRELMRGFLGALGGKR
jgi:uncharacterized protein